ncbi:MAG: helix-turn-helix domain-containing protein [Ignavibacteria bacterium]|nr:helix-turn-helix domain-containing protein [Ignavibacteria bacterium]
MDYNQNLKNLREALGIKKSWLEKMTGISSDTIRRIEKAESENIRIKSATVLSKRKLILFINENAEEIYPKILSSNLTLDENLKRFDSLKEKYSQSFISNKLQCSASQISQTLSGKGNASEEFKSRLNNLLNKLY